MKKLMISLAAVAAIGAAVPAAAQSYGYGSYGNYGGYDRSAGYGYGGYDRNAGYRYGSASQRGDNQINDREARMAAELRNAEARGQISHEDYVGLSREGGRVEMIEKRYRQTGNGLSAAEIQDINRRLDRVEAAFQNVRENSRYGYGYGDQRYGNRGGW